MRSPFSHNKRDGNSSFALERAGPAIQTLFRPLLCSDPVAGSFVSSGVFFMRYSCLRVYSIGRLTV